MKSNFPVIPEPRVVRVCVCAHAGTLLLVCFLKKMHQVQMLESPGTH